MRARVLLGGAGVLLLGYGAWRLLAVPRLSHPATVGVWLVAALVLHDGVLAPSSGALGVVLRRAAPPRARRHVQGAAVAIALVAVVAAPLIHRHGRAEPGTTLESQDYASHLALIAAAIAGVAALSYAVQVLRDRRAQRPSAANVRPPDDQTSSTP